MDPAMGSGETFYPVYYRAGDRDMLDAIGWDYPLVNQSCPDAAQTACGVTRYLDNSTLDALAGPHFSCRSSGAQVGSLFDGLPLEVCQRVCRVPVPPGYTS